MNPIETEKSSRSSVFGCCSTQRKKNQEETNLIQRVNTQKGCVQGGLKYHSAVRDSWVGKERMGAVLQEDETGQSKIWRGGNRTIRFLRDIQLPNPQTEITRNWREHARQQTSTKCKEAFNEARGDQCQSGGSLSVCSQEILGQLEGN